MAAREQEVYLVAALFVLFVVDLGLRYFFNEDMQNLLLTKPQISYIIRVT